MACIDCTELLRFFRGLLPDKPTPYYYGGGYQRILTHSPPSTLRGPEPVLAPKPDPYMDYDWHLPANDRPVTTEGWHVV